MIKEIIIKCDDEQNKAHEAWLEEREEVLKKIKDLQASEPNEQNRDILKNIGLFIKRGEM